MTDNTASAAASSDAKAADAKTERAAPITIKKYANRRLYNTATSSYVTLDHLCQMVKEGTDFVVFDAKNGEDITRSVLTQIIVEEESKGQNLLPIGFLRQLISFYGDSLGGLVPRYLEYSMQSFSHNGEQMRSLMQNTLGMPSSLGSSLGAPLGMNALSSMFPLQNFEEMSKQNKAYFENALKMFAPFYGDATTSTAKADEAEPEPEDPTIRDLKAKLNDMQNQLNSLIKK